MDNGARANKQPIPRGDLVARLAMLVAVFLFGGLLGAIGAPPFPAFRDGYRATIALVAEQAMDRPEILGRRVYPGVGLVKYRPERAAGGLTIIQGTMPEGHELRLLSEDGEQLHRWRADFFAAWPDAEKIFPANRIPSSEHHYFIQGFWPLPDGSMLTNFGELGTVKLDRCSQIVWRLAEMNHHSITPSEDGTFWIPAHISAYETDERYFPRGKTAQQLDDASAVGAHNYHNSVIKVDATGQVLKEISILEAIYDAGLEAAIYDSMRAKASDPTHLNDIDVVTPELARKIAGVQTGDLMVSLRNTAMVAIIDQDNGELLWHKRGPWYRQHDPDITESGAIEVYNNRAKMVGASVTQSRIERYDPATDETETVYPVSQNDTFYSSIMGSHQLLANGNRLIVESTAGRVFEVTPVGEVVWDYRIPYNDNYAALVSHAMRVPENYFKGDIRCDSNTK